MLGVHGDVPQPNRHPRANVRGRRRHDPNQVLPPIGSDDRLPAGPTNAPGLCHGRLAVAARLPTVWQCTIPAHRRRSICALSDMLPQHRGRTSDTLGWTPPPDGFALRQVTYILRHGERAPVRSRLETASPPIVEPWNLCHTSHEFDKAVLRFADDDCSKTIPSRASIQRRVEIAKLGSTSRPGAPGDCLLGELTDLGRESMLKIGLAIRRIYIDQLHLLPTTLRAKDGKYVYFRSTNIPRTKQSMDQVITGLLGSPEDIPDALVPLVYVRNTGQEDMLPNSRPCPRLAQLLRKFSDEAATLYNPELAKFDDQIAPHNSGKGARIDGHPRLSGLIDTARAALAHGIPIPRPFLDENVVRPMEKAVVHEWFAGYQSKDPVERTQYRRLAMGEFLASLYDHMAQRVVGADERRLSVFLAHDATLVGILQCLECFNDKWPDFSAAISCELFDDERASKTDTSEDRAYVRCRYGDEVLQLPGCAPDKKHYPGHPELCTLAAFREVVVDRLRNPANVSREVECGLSLLPATTN